MYGGDEIMPNNEVFIWFSETGGGQGLAWRAYVQSVQRLGRDRMRVGVRPAIQSSMTLGIAQLDPFRDVRDGSPHSELSRKLYYQSHHKIAALSDSERALLLTHFT